MEYTFVRLNVYHPDASGGILVKPAIKHTFPSENENENENENMALDFKRVNQKSHSPMRQHDMADSKAYADFISGRINALW